MKVKRKRMKGKLGKAGKEDIFFSRRTIVGKLMCIFFGKRKKKEKKLRGKDKEEKKWKEGEWKILRNKT